MTVAYSQSFALEEESLAKPNSFEYYEKTFDVYEVLAYTEGAET